MEAELVLCYNRGCGSKFNPEDNPEGNSNDVHQC